MSGAGKSFHEHQLLYRLILAERDKGGEYYFADYKGDDTFSYLKGCPRSFTYMDTLTALDLVHARLLARQSGADPARNPVTLVWDEYMAQMLNLLAQDQSGCRRHEQGGRGVDAGPVPGYQARHILPTA